MNPKKAAAERAVDYIRNGMTIGLGTGSTASWAIKEIGTRVRAGLTVQAIATSVESEKLARESGIPLAEFSTVHELDLTIDGADEVDGKGNLIKGGGGALLREKIVAFNSKEFYVVVDESKQVGTLGRFPLPLEIVPFGHEFAIRQLMRSAHRVAIRKTGENSFVTDNGNLIADCDFFPIGDPLALNRELKAIPGVVETGLFPASMVTAVITGQADGTTIVVQFK